VLDGRLPLYWALDFNVDPMCSLVAQKAGEEIRVLDEIVLRRASTAEACEEFHARYPQHPALTVYGDASGARMQTAGTTDYRIIREFLTREGYKRFRFQIPVSNPSVRERIALMNAKLLSASGDSNLVVDPKCRGLIQDFEEVSFKPDSQAIDKDRDPKRTHLSDALGYLVWQECRPQAAYGERDRRLM
jgi:hypothetical protein